MTDASVNIRLNADDARFQSAMKRVETTMGRVRQRMEQVARAARAIFIAGQAAAAGSVLAFASFEKVMARVRALTNATDEEFQQLNDTARELGRATVFSANQAGEAMAAFALAGFEVRDIIKALPDTLNLAAVGTLGMGQAAEIAAGIMRGMKIDTEELSRVIDVLAAAATSSATNIPQLGEAMKVVGPIAKNAGLSLEETVAVIRAFSDIMIQGGAAGTALRNILLRLTGGTSEVTKALRRLNVSIADTNGEMKPLADIIDEIRESMKNFDEVTQQQILSQLAGARAAAAFSEALTLGGDTIREYTRQLEDAGGVADRVAKQQMDNLIDRFELLKSAIVEAAIRLGQEFIPAVDFVRRTVNQAVDAFNGLDRSVVQVVANMLLLGAGIAAASLALKALSFIVGTVVAGFAAFQAVIAAVAASLGTATTIMVGFTAVAKGLAVLVGGVLVGAIVALAAAIGGVQIAMQGLIADLQNIGREGKETADIMRQLRQVQEDFDKAATNDERAKALEKRLGLLRQLEARFRAQAAAEQGRLNGVVGTGAGAEGREALQQNIDAANRNAERFAQQARRTEADLALLNQELIKNKTTQAEAAMTDSERADALAAFNQTLTRTKEEQRELGAFEAARAQGLADLTEKEKESIRSALELAASRRDQAEAEASAIEQLKQIRIETKAALGVSDEFTIRLRELAKVGVNPKIIEQLRVEKRLLEDITEIDAKERQLEDEAERIRELIRTDEERLAIELRRIRALQFAGKLTAEEANRAREITYEKQKQQDLEKAQFDSLTGLFRRIQASAANFSARDLNLLNQQVAADRDAPRDKEGRLIEQGNRKLDGIKEVMERAVEAITELDNKARFN